MLEAPTFKGRPGWEFTDLTRFELEAYHSAPAREDAELRVWTHAEGAVRPGAAVEDGPVVLSLSEARERHPELVDPHLYSVVPADDDHFTSLAEREEADGAFVWIPRGVKMEAPILLAAATAGENTALHRRVLIVLEDGAEAEVWEEWSSDDESMLNVVTEIVVGQNARLTYACAQALEEGSWVFGTQRATVGRDGYLNWVALGLGGRGGRVRMETRLAGPGGEARVTGAYAPHARQHVDYDTTQEHEAPQCISDLAFRGILADRSSAVWKGMIKVDPGAQQTDAFQECRNLLLTKKAHADAIPGLEILANDVRCTHAAAIAQIDAEQLFYLQSRGLKADSARRLVIEGFLSALVERLDEGSALREQTAAALEARLQTILG